MIKANLRTVRPTRLFARRWRSDIEDFKSKKTEYTFGHNFNQVKAVEEEYNPEVKMQRAREEQEENVILQDPRLLSLKKGSPEYKDMLFELHLEYAQNEEKNRSKYEFWERMRTIGLGVLLLVGAISSHQLLMNHEYWRKKLMVDYYYKIDSKASDLSDPKKNKNTIDSLVSKLNLELDQDTIAAIKNSTQVPGLYVNGVINGKKLPVRLPFFDDMFIRDVLIKDNYLAVVSESGDLYHYSKEMEIPRQVKLPHSLISCKLSETHIYGLTKKGELIYVPRSDYKGEFKPCGTRSWTGSKYNTFNKIKVSENIKDFAIGAVHCVMLSKSGKLYVSSINDVTPQQNFGQFGLPEASPLSKNFPLKKHEAVELVMINNQIVQSANGDKSVVPRKFTDIACSDTHTVACDSENNIWAWGSNSVGQCAIDVNYNSLVQPIPKKVLSREQLMKDYKLSDVQIDQLYAGNETTYITLNSDGNQLLFAVGGGIKGQLGNSQFLHVSSKPSLVKSLANLLEFNEDKQKVENIGIKNVAVGNNHVFVTLNNAGHAKDIVAWGDNEYGQLGNGKKGKSAKPLKLPQLIEPDDVIDKEPKKLARRLDRVANSQLRLLSDEKVENSLVDQVLYAGENSSAIYYKKV